MGKTTKKWLVIGALLIVTGLIMFVAVLAGQNFDFARLGTVKYVTNTYELTDAFDSLSIQTDTADVVFVLSREGICKVECYEDENARHSVTVNEDTLSIQLEDNRAWYEYIGIHIESPKITVYLPKEEYMALSIEASTSDIDIPKELSFDNIDISTNTGDVSVSASTTGAMKLKTSTGDITVEGATAGSMEVNVSTGLITIQNVVCWGDVVTSVSTGKTNLTAVTCKNLISNGDTGDITLERVIVEEKLSVERDTGDVHFNYSDAAEIYVKTDTGDVTGSLRTAKVFITSTDTGSVRVPASTVGGRCEITTDTGDIKITVP